MKLIFSLVALACLFGGGGFYVGGAVGSVIGVALLIGLVGHFAVGFHVES